MQNIYLGDEYELSPWFKTEITQEIALQISSNVYADEIVLFLTSSQNLTYIYI